MRSKFKWIGIVVLGVLFICGQAIYAADEQPEPDPAASAALEEMEANLQADLAAIAADREAVIDDIVAMWPTEPGGEEDLRLALSLADDEDLLAILNANSFNEVVATLGGDDLLEVRTDRDYVFTPVTPCRIADTRVAGPGIIVAGTGRIWRVYGNGAQMAAQGGSPSGCLSLRGEPRGVLINMIAVDPLGKGNLQASPIGASQGLSVNFNGANNVNLANAGAIQTSYLHPTGADIEVSANFASVHAVVQVLGYFHEINGEDIAAADSSGTISGGLAVGSGSANYTTLASRVVTVPVNGRVVIMGEASWSNNGTGFLGCRFLEDGSQVDFWWWDAGDSDGWIDQHQNRFYHKTVSAGTRTYALQCYRFGGTSATAYYRNVTVMFFEEDL
jgi:hypothetical protein